LVISGDEFVLSGATIIQSTLALGFSGLVLEPGAVSSFITIDASFARMEVDSGAVANNTVVEDEEELVYGVDNDALVSGGSYLFNGLINYYDATQFVFSGGVANNTTIGGNTTFTTIGVNSVNYAPFGDQLVEGGTAIDVVVLIRGTQDVSAGGTAEHSSVYSGGILEGGGVTSATINAGGIEYLYGLDNGSIIENHGTQIDSAGAQAFSDLVYGFQKIDAGATATNETVGVAGTAQVYGTVTGDTTISGGLVELESGASAAGIIDFTGNDGMLQLARTASFSGTTINDFAPSDTIILEGVTGSADFTAATEILTVNGTGLQFSGISAADTFVSAPVTASGLASTEITIIKNAECFLAGTRIMTTRGCLAIENLGIGEQVLTAKGGVERIEWIGVRNFDGRFVGDNHLVLPVTISANAIADGVPARDLHVSPGHGVFIDGALVPAWRLINGKTITQPEIMQTEISYYHIELASHAVILAENCPVESYLDDGCRKQFQNASTYSKRDGGPMTLLPRVESGFVLEAIRARLNARAGIETKAENASNAVIGYVDNLGPNAVSGWAQCPEDHETPVRLEVYFWLAGLLMREEVLANVYRADLRKAGMGSGCHGFEVELPDGAKSIHVLRQADRTPLALTEAAMRTVAAA
jgi:hypothetical protein